jgi:hypothetical protein
MPLLVPKKPVLIVDDIYNMDILSFSSTFLCFTTGYTLKWNFFALW